MKRLLLLSALLLVGCPSEGGLSSVAPVAVLRPAPGTVLGFEEVVLGKSEAAPRIVTVRNEGEVTLTISAELEGGHPFRVSSFHRTVAPGDEGEIFLRFEPGAQGEFEALLKVTTNDPKLPVAEYPVRGSAREQCRFYAWPPRQQFQVHETRSVTLYNESNTTCEITRLFTDESLFELLDDPPLPHTIPPLGELVLQVEHVRRTEEPGRPVRLLHIKNSDGIELEVSFEGALPIWNCLGAFPPELEFPDTDLGVRGRARAVVYSRCEEPAEIRSAHVGLGYYFFNVDQSQFPITVPPFGSAEVLVDYLPFSEHGDGGRLSINTNDAANRQFRIDLAGKARIPELLTVPVIDFGAAVPGCNTRQEPVPLLAVGEARTIVDRLELDGDESFRIIGVLVDGRPLSDPTPPFTIPSGSSAHVLIDFEPTVLSSTEHEAALTVHHNAPERTDTIELRGHTVEGGGATENFTAPEAASVDVLFVVDDSCSMLEEQVRLKEAIDELLVGLDVTGADYQIAVTAAEEESRSPGWPRQCPPHPYVIADEYADPATREHALGCAVRIGNSNHDRQAALGAATKALHRSVDPAASVNPLPGFLRPEADLAVVVVSDEEDQSKASNNAVRDFLWSVKGSYRPDRVAVHALAGDPSSACMDDPWLTPSERYRAITRETGGTFQDICTTDFVPLLDNLRASIFEPKHRFDLSRRPDPASLQVFVDGTPIPVDGTDGYLFDTNTNAVILNGSARPSPGVAITILYDDACL